MIRVNFDGDSYDMTVPTKNIVRQILDADQDGALTLDYYWQRGCIIQSDLHGDKLILRSKAAEPGELDEDHTLLDIRNGELYDADGDTKYLRVLLFRPMLVPLDKHKKEDLAAINGAVNGTILEGGTFFVDVSRKPTVSLTPLTEDMKPIEQPQKNAGFVSMSSVLQKMMSRDKNGPSTFDQERFQLRDSTGIPGEILKWLYWDGMLICTRPICYTNAMDLKEAGVF